MPQPPARPASTCGPGPLPRAHGATRLLLSHPDLAADLGADLHGRAQPAPSRPGSHRRPRGYRAPLGLSARPSPAPPPAGRRPHRPHRGGSPGERTERGRPRGRLSPPHRERAGVPGVPNHNCGVVSVLVLFSRAAQIKYSYLLKNKKMMV